MKKSYLFMIPLLLIWFTFATESFPAFPMTIYWNTNLDWWTLKVYDWSNNEISSYEIREDWKYWSENAFVLPLSLNSFDWNLSFKAVYNWTEYDIEWVDGSNRWEWCPAENSITFVSENCRYDLMFKLQWTENIKSWIRLRKDKCPNWDHSDSYYDGTCESSKKKNHKSADEIYDETKFDSQYSSELNQAYQYAYHYGITTQDSISSADMEWSLTRIAMAKMLSQYAIKVLWITPDSTKSNKFADVSSDLDSQYNDWVTLAYQLWIMWINMPNNKFRPFDTVTRAEFATALSRLKYHTDDGKDVYYSTHIKLLHQLWIITNTDPAMKELRWYVMLMLMRSAEK